MMNKNYRKIIVKNEEYDWLYIRPYDRNNILIYKIIYNYNSKTGDKIRKRRFLKSYDIDVFCEDTVKYTNITPDIVRKFIEYVPSIGGYIITTKYLRKLKLLKING